MKDILGNFLRITPPFRGKRRLQNFWEQRLAKQDRRMARLPDGSVVDTEMSIPYERMVWLQDEEWDELCYLQHKLQTGETFVDVGANIGLWTLVAASTVGAHGRIFSFEPNPSTFKKLVVNIIRNQRNNIVEASQYAVSRSAGSVAFFCATEHNVSAISSNFEGPDVVQVQTVSLDSILAGTRVAGMKFDTEGHEVAALEGALQTIKTFSPWLIIEFNTTLLSSPLLGDWPVYQFLSSRGYKPFIYGKTKEETEVNAGFSILGFRNILFQTGYKEPV